MSAGKDLRILVIENNPGDVRLIREMLDAGMGSGFELKAADTLAQGIEMLGSGGYDILLLDLGLPDSWGLASFDAVNKTDSQLPVIVLTGNMDADIGVEAVQRGAQDYLIKGQVDELVLPKAIKYAIERKRAETIIVQKNKRLVMQYEQLKEVFEELRKSEERFGHLVQNLPHVFYRQHYENGVYDYISPQVERLAGYTPEEVVSMGRDGFLDAVVHPEDRQSLGSIRELHVRHKGRRPQPEALKATSTRQFRIVNKRGVTLYIEDMSTPWIDNKGKTIGSSGVWADITERKLAELALKQSENKFRTLFNSAGDAIYILDMNAHIIEVNDLACELHGYPREKLITFSMPDIDTAGPAVIEERLELLKEVGAVCFESEHRNRTGHAFPVEVKTVDINYFGESAAMCIARDISERKRTEDTFRALSRQVLAAQEHERGRLSRELHDGLGQQMTALGFEIECLKSRRPDIAGEIDYLSDALQKITDETWLICRGLRPPALDSLGLSSALEMLVREFENGFAGRVEVDIRQVEDKSFSRDIPITVYRILQEALHNVFRHANATCVDICFQQADGELRLYLKDDGVGFSVDAIRSFDRLGIPGMRERVAHCNGIMEINSRPGMGTRLAVAIPVTGNPDHRPGEKQGPCANPDNRSEL